MNTRIEISKRLVLINSGSAVLTQVLKICVLVWLYQHLLSRISAEEYSLIPVVAAIMVFPPLLGTVLKAGLGRYVIEAYARGDDRRAVQIVSTMFPLLVAVAAVILAGGLTLAWYVDRVLTISPERVWDARIMTGLLMIEVALGFSAAAFSTGFYVRQKFALLNLIKIGVELLRMAILFVLLFAVSTRALWVIVASVSAGLTGLVIQVACSRRLLPNLRFNRREIRWGLCRELVSFGGWNLLIQVSEMIHMAAGPIILNKFATATDVASFHVGSLPGKHAMASMYMLTRPVGPVLTAMHAKEEKERLRNAYLRGGRLAMWVFLIVAVPLVVYRSEVISLYTSGKYMTAAPVLMMLIASRSFIMPNLMMPMIAYAKANIRPLALQVIAVQLVNLVLTLYLVGRLRMGAVGSALSSLITCSFGWTVLHGPLGLRMTGTSFRRFFKETLIPGACPAMLAAGVWAALGWWLQPTTWSALGGCYAVGAVCYIAVLLLFCLQAKDRDDLRHVAVGVKGLFSGAGSNG